MGKTKSALQAVCDAGPLIHLDELGCIELLGDFDRVVIAQAVRDEVHRHRPRALEGVAFDVEVPSAEAPPLRELLATACRAYALGRGETEALSLMERTPHALFLTDDAAARLVALHMGYRVHGTVGVLIRSVRRGSKGPNEVVELLKSIPGRSTLHIRPSLLDEVIQTVRREFKLM